MLFEALKKIGLSDKEAKIYLASLQLGAQPISLIAKKAGLNRSTTYLILDDLKSKGLASQYVKKDIRYCSVVSPQNLILYLDHLKNDLDNQSKNISTLLPQFSNLINPNTSKPKITFFENLTGIKEVYEDTLRDNKTIYAIESVDAMPQELREYLFKDYLKRRIETGTFAYVIASESKRGKTFQKEDKLSKRKTLLVNIKKYPFAIETNIYGNKVAFMAYKNAKYVGIIIENEQIAKTMKCFFDLTWDLLSLKIKNNQ